MLEAAFLLLLLPFILLIPPYVFWPAIVMIWILLLVHFSWLWLLITYSGAEFCRAAVILIMVLLSFSSSPPVSVGA